MVDNSPCVGNFHVASDIEDYHFYRAIPDHADEWEQFVGQFAARLAPTYSPFGDAERTGDEPLILKKKVVLKNDYIHHVVDVYMI